MTPATPVNPFAVILEQVMLLGGFAKVVGVLAFTASLAAIMSTADSLIIAISQLVTARRMLSIHSNQQQLLFKLRGLDVLYPCFRQLWLRSSHSYGTRELTLAPIQFGISFQACPPFIVGLLFAPSHRCDIHPWNLAGGAWVGVVVVFPMYFGYVNVVPNPRPINGGVLAFGCRLATTFLLECARRLAVDRKNRSVFSPGQPEMADTEKQTLDEMTADFTNRPAWDSPEMQRFGHHPLTPAFLLWELVEDIKEPMTNIWACGFLFLVACMLTPLVPENKPPFDEQNGEFVYEPATFNGLPWWAFKIILLGIIPYSSFLSGWLIVFLTRLNLTMRRL
jgi:hypothetical protein